MKCHGVLLVSIKNIWPESLQHFRTVCVTHESEQLMVVLLKKSVQACFLQHNFPMLRYLKVKRFNTFIHGVFKFKLVFSNVFIQSLGFAAKYRTVTGLHIRMVGSTWSCPPWLSCLTEAEHAGAGGLGPMWGCTKLIGNCMRLAPMCAFIYLKKKKLAAPRQSSAADPAYDNMPEGQFKHRHG